MYRNRELDLEDLLADPLVRLVMSSDSVQESDIRRLMSARGAGSLGPVETRWMPGHPRARAREACNGRAPASS